MKNYVVGFAFHNKMVVLIRKNRPEWQKGKLNGVGGHVEEGETYEEAMAREFEEETGVRCEDWRPFALLTQQKLPQFAVKCFAVNLSTDYYYRIETQTDEEVEVVYYDHLPDNTISNLPWLVPMAKNSLEDELFEFAYAYYKENNG